MVVVNNHGLILAIGNTEMNMQMETPGGLSLDLDRLGERKNGLFSGCKDMLCPAENQIKEWFPSELKARIRARALDPYGLNREKYVSTKKTGNCEKAFRISYKCTDETCHSALVLRKVKPDSKGNEFGLFGCLTHQHPLPRDNKRSNIILPMSIQICNHHLK